MSECSKQKSMFNFCDGLFVVVAVLIAVVVVISIPTKAERQFLVSSNGGKPLVLHCDGKVLTTNIDAVYRSTDGAGVVYKERGSDIIHGVACSNWKLF